MEANKLEIKTVFDVTSGFFEQLDENTAHVELNGCIRLVTLTDTIYSTMAELETYIKSLYEPIE
jgi:hypothetical protein